MTWHKAQAEIAANGSANRLTVKGTANKRIKRLIVDVGNTVLGAGGDIDISESNAFRIAPKGGTDEPNDVRYISVQGQMDDEYSRDVKVIVPDDIYIDYTTRTTNCIVVLRVETDDSLIDR